MSSGRDGPSLGRREALLAALGLPVVAACGGAKEFSCDDARQVSAAEREKRTAQQYADRTTRPGERCAGCTQYQGPPSGSCGTCKLLPGPVHPEGWCRVFARAG
ncbi:MAG: high-potential iron-sulfur protein [Deltaproteobacteria bacterium]|nr:high-potential iron-sulfur protein [Deltaproteobacteria bacterium]